MTEAAPQSHLSIEVDDLLDANTAVHHVEKLGTRDGIGRGHPLEFVREGHLHVAVFSELLLRQEEDLVGVVRRVGQVGLLGGGGGRGGEGRGGEGRDNITTRILA